MFVDYFVEEVLGRFATAGNLDALDRLVRARNHPVGQCLLRRGGGVVDDQQARHGRRLARSAERAQDVFERRGEQVVCRLAGVLAA